MNCINLYIIICKDANIVHKYSYIVSYLQFVSHIENSCAQSGSLLIRHSSYVCLHLSKQTISGHSSEHPLAILDADS